MTTFHPPTSVRSCPDSPDVLIVVNDLGHEMRCRRPEPGGPWSLEYRGYNSVIPGSHKYFLFAILLDAYLVWRGQDAATDAAFASGLPAFDAALERGMAAYAALAAEPDRGLFRLLAAEAGVSAPEMAPMH